MATQSMSSRVISAVSSAARDASQASSLPVSWARRTNFVIPAPTTATLRPISALLPRTR
jgi:hypothetical protein